MKGLDTEVEEALDTTVRNAGRVHLHSLHLARES